MACSSVVGVINLIRNQVHVAGGSVRLSGEENVSLFIKHTAQLVKAEMCMNAMQQNLIY